MVRRSDRMETQQGSAAARWARRPFSGVRQADCGISGPSVVSSVVVEPSTAPDKSLDLQAPSRGHGIRFCGRARAVCAIWARLVATRGSRTRLAIRALPPDGQIQQAVSAKQRRGFHDSRVDPFGFKRRTQSRIVCPVHPVGFQDEQRSSATVKLRPKSGKRRWPRCGITVHRSSQPCESAPSGGSAGPSGTLAPLGATSADDAHRDIRWVAVRSMRFIIPKPRRVHGESTAHGLRRPTCSTERRQADRTSRRRMTTDRPLCGTRAIADPLAEHRDQLAIP